MVGLKKRCIFWCNVLGCRIVCFFKKVLVLNPYPKTPSPWEGAILLGLPPQDPVGGYPPATPFSEKTKVYRQSEAVHFWCSVFFGGKLWVLHGMGFNLLIERTSFESGNYLLIFIGRTGHKLCGFFNIA